MKCTLLLSEGIECDILAGEQGPSCKTIDQIPDLKVIHLRFIERRSQAGCVKPSVSDTAQAQNDNVKDEFKYLLVKKRCATTTS